MLLSHRHLVYCGLSFVSLLVLCYLPCDILIKFIAEPFRYVPPPSASCCLLWSEHCFTVGIMLPSVQHTTQYYCRPIYVPAPCLLWSGHCFTVGFMFPSVQHTIKYYYGTISICSSTTASCLCGLNIVSLWVLCPPL